MQIQVLHYTCDKEETYGHSLIFPYLFFLQYYTQAKRKTNLNYNIRV